MTNIIHVGGWDGAEYAIHDGALLIFEPQAGPFAQLERNLGARPGVRLVHAAAGVDDGTATMYRVAPDHSSSLLEPGELRYGFLRNGTETVRVTTVDGEVARADVQFDGLRIDTQGWELEVLKGAHGTLRSLTWVEVELHDPSVYPGAATLEDIDAFMFDHGFERTAFDREHSDDLGDAAYRRIRRPVGETSVT